MTTVTRIGKHVHAVRIDGQFAGTAVRNSHAFRRQSADRWEVLSADGHVWHTFRTLADACEYLETAYGVAA